MATHRECGKVGVIASGVTGYADVCPTVSELGVADLQGATWVNYNAP